MKRAEHFYTTGSLQNVTAMENSYRGSFKKCKIDDLPYYPAIPPLEYIYTHTHTYCNIYISKGLKWV